MGTASGMVILSERRPRGYVHRVCLHMSQKAQGATRSLLCHTHTQHCAVASMHPATYHPLDVRERCRVDDGPAARIVVGAVDAATQQWPTAIQRDARVAKVQE